MPQPLVDQLARPGRMFIPVGEDKQLVVQVGVPKFGSQRCPHFATKVDKDAEGKVTQKELFGVMVCFISTAI